MYMGMSPFEAPATYTLLQYAEYAKGENRPLPFPFVSLFLPLSNVEFLLLSSTGVFYPIGGFQTVVAAFAKVAEQFGARFIYDATVTRITLAGDEGPEEDEVEKMPVPDTKRPKTSRVKGVELADGTKIKADAVVSNADLIWTVSRASLVGIEGLLADLQIMPLIPPRSTTSETETLARSPCGAMVSDPTSLSAACSHRLLMQNASKARSRHAVPSPSTGV